MTSTKWLLTSVLSQLHFGPGAWYVGLHRFGYDADNRLATYMEMDYIDPTLPLTRVDSFFYDAKDRLTQISSKDHHGPNSYKKIFVYGPGNRKLRNLKYRIDDSGNYYLSDSTIYLYSDTTIRKVTFHIGKTITDTALFVYSHSGNLVAVKLGEFNSTYHELGPYDNKVNPATYFGQPSIEIDPYDEVDWDIEFWITMQSPAISKNNYQFRKSDFEYQYFIGYSVLDTTVGEIFSYRAEMDGEMYQNFEYRAAN